MTAARPDCGICGTLRPPGTNCPVCSRARRKAYKVTHPEKERAYKKLAYAKGAAARAAKKAAKAATKPLRRKTARIAWKVRNPGMVNASTAQRFAAKLQARPAWANKLFIEEAYVAAALRTKLTGINWHVDHIVPLRSKVVCGLHVEFNLRVIPAIENMSKNNRRWPDMP